MDGARVVTYAGVEYKVSLAHRAADAMPWATDDSDTFSDLVESMRRDGFDPNEPVTLQAGTGLVIDGRRRELAAAVAGVEPVYREVDWPEEQILRWVEHELHRRNISPSQRAASAVELASLRTQGRPQSGETKGQHCPVSVSAAEIAAQIGVGEKTVDAAAKVKKKAPELLPAVKEGKLAANVAAKVADLPKKKREKVAKADDPKAAAKEELDRAAAKVAAPDEPAASEADEFVSAVESLCRDTDQIVARMKGLKSSRYAYSINVDSSVAQVEAARKTLWQGRPAHACPYCKGEGCKTCAQTGRVKKSTFDSGREAVGGAE